ncbi:MAG: hypothetical protein M1820_007380 [Bogoriella megaspora]|nr:MAG: hypothetical protein M1820_007380 [Bogoriella megaspora]
MDTRTYSSLQAIEAPELQVCHFLGLPAEIRNMIYEYLLTDDIVILSNKVDVVRGAKIIGILFTCKQIYGEFHEMFWAEANFSLQVQRRPWMGKPKVLRPLISGNSLTHIRQASLEVEAWLLLDLVHTVHRKPFLQMLASLTGLRYFKLDVHLIELYQRSSSSLPFHELHEFPTKPGMDTMPTNNPEDYTSTMRSPYYMQRHSAA